MQFAKCPMKKTIFEPRGFLVLVCLAAFLFAAKADQVVYDDALENGWENWGWATLNYANTSPVHSGSDSISVTFSGAWQGIQIWHPDMDSTPYAAISFWLNGGSSGDNNYRFMASWMPAVHSTSGKAPVTSWPR